MTVAELKKLVDEAFADVPVDTECVIAMMDGRDIQIGKVYVGVYTDGSKKVFVEEKMYEEIKIPPLRDGKRYGIIMPL